MATAFTAVVSSASNPQRRLFPRRSATTKALAFPPAAAASDLSPATLAVLGGGSVAALAAALSLSDPERRRRRQAAEVGGTDKDVVRDYFNSTGFQRWRKIYDDSTDDVNRVQLDIRLGHARTVESTLEMLRDGGPLDGVTVCDAGCGTGSLAVPLAKLGADVTATDISAAMVEEARRRAEEELKGGDFPMPRFDVRDLESLDGRAGIMYATKDVDAGPLLKSNMFSLSGAQFFGTVNRSINLGGQSALALRLLLAIFSSKISLGANRPFGDEFRAARKASEEVGAEIVLGDRPIEITLRRAWNSLELKDKLRLLNSIILGIFSPSYGRTEVNLKDLEMEGRPSQLYEQLNSTYPSLLQPLLHERDTYLAWSLKRSKAVNKSKRVVGVIGKGHMNGVVYALITDQGNLRFRDLVGRTSAYGSDGWIGTAVRNLVRDTVLALILWALYEQLMT